MQNTPSGDYRLPGSTVCLGGNLALRMARLFPSRVRSNFVSKSTYYQVANGTEVENYQGHSMKKWEALGIPENLKGKSVLDIGCAEGFFGRECAKRGAAPVVGVDTGIGRLFYATFVAMREGLKVKYKMGVFPNLGLTQRFDYVLCLSVLHHSVSKKNMSKVLVENENPDELIVLRQQLKALKSFTAPGGRCIIEIPYEYEDPAAERAVVNFEAFNTELKAAGFAKARCIGSWEYNPKHRATKDRILYVAEA